MFYKNFFPQNEVIYRLLKKRRFSASPDFGR
jgi:hypothetical protein